MLIDDGLVGEVVLFLADDELNIELVLTLALQIDEIVVFDQVHNLVILKYVILIGKHDDGQIVNDIQTHVLDFIIEVCGVLVHTLVIQV